METEALHVPSSEPVMYFYESGCSAIAFGRGESNELKTKNFSSITFYKSPDVEGIVARVQKDGCGAAKLSQRDGRLMVRSQAECRTLRLILESSIRERSPSDARRLWRLTAPRLCTGFGKQSNESKITS